jgi:hypothetical protein
MPNGPCVDSSGASTSAALSAVGSAAGPWP